MPLFTFLFVLFTSLQDSLEQRLETMAGKKRVVLIYCPKNSDAEFKLQQRLLKEIGKSFSEDDIEVIECPGEALTSTDSLHLTNRFRYKPGHFCCWLIGKDGEVKLISGKPVNPQQIFGLSDALPKQRQNKP